MATKMRRLRPNRCRRLPPPQDHLNLRPRPYPVTGATADLTIFLLLGDIRKLNSGLFALLKGLFKIGVDFGHDPKGKTLGISGMGRIGQAVAQRALSFDMNIIYHNRIILSEDLAAGIPRAGFQQLLEESDVISIYLPPNQSTRHLIGVAEIASMKKGVVIVNTARGAILDEAALAGTLGGGNVGSV
jgi:glyoxylate reductase